MNKNIEIKDIEIKSEWNIGKIIKRNVCYSWDELMDIIDDLVSDYDYLKEEFEEFKRDVEDNYRPIPVSEQVGISDNDFI